MTFLISQWLVKFLINEVKKCWLFFRTWFDFFDQINSICQRCLKINLYFLNQINSDLTSHSVVELTNKAKFGVAHWSKLSSRSLIAWSKVTLRAFFKPLRITLMYFWDSGGNSDETLSCSINSCRMNLYQDCKMASKNTVVGLKKLLFPLLSGSE